MQNTQDNYEEERMREAIRMFEEKFIRAKTKELYRVTLEAIERPLIELALERTFGNKLKAARILGINRNTLHAKIKKLKIDTGKYKD